MTSNNNEASNATNNANLVTSPNLEVYAADGSTTHKAYVINYDDLYNLSRLRQTQHFTEAMRRTEDEIDRNRNIANQNGLVFEDDFLDKQLLYACFQLYPNVIKEIKLSHSIISRRYQSKYPMLASWVPNSIDYARVVKKTVNQLDLTTVDLQDILPDDVISVVHAYATSTPTRVSFPQAVIEEIVEECDRILALDVINRKILRFLESDASHLARFIIAKFKEKAEILPALELAAAGIRR